MPRPTAALLIRLLLPALLPALFLAACAPVVAPPLPAPDQARLDRILDLAGENAPELRAFLDTYARDPDRLEAARFLVMNLPLADAASLTARDMRANLDQAFRARQEFPWARDLPRDVFLRYVLPHRTAQEPAQPFRKQLHQALAPRLAGMTDAARAAQVVALWCLEQAEYVATSRRDQPPLDTMALGKARCEEAVILFTAAARSVGLPAREAITPAWQFADDNHSWAEVMVDGRWHYLDPANPGPALDRAWFTDNARKAAFVFATAYGSGAPGEPGEPVYQQGHGYTRLNATGRYARTYRLRVRVLDADGLPLDGASVFACVYNYASLKPVARIACDEQGQGSLLLGQSALLLTASRQGRRDFALVRLGPGVPDQEAVLDLRRDRLPNGGFWLPFGEWPAPEPRPHELEEQEKALEQTKAQLAAQRTQRLHAAQGMALAVLDRAGVRDPGVRDAVARAGLAGPGLARALAGTSGDLRRALASRLAAMDDKDLAGCDPDELAADTRAAMEARGLARERLGLEYPDDLFREFVLDTRLSPYEPWSALHLTAQGHRELLQDSVAATALAVNQLAAGLRQGPGSALGPAMTPGQALRARSVASDQDRALAAAGLLRGLGVPARCLDQWGWVEFHDGSTWQPLYPAAPEALGDQERDPDSASYYAARAGLDAVLTVDGRKAEPGRVRYFRDLSLNRFAESGPDRQYGVYEAMEPDPNFFEGGYDDEAGMVSLRFPPGQWHFVAGARNEQGEAYVRVLPFALEPGQVLRITGPLDVPPQ